MSKVYRGHVDPSDILFYCTGLAAEAAVFSAAAEVLTKIDIENRFARTTTYALSSDFRLLGISENFISTCRRTTLFYAENGYGGTGQLIGELLPVSAPVTPQPMKVFRDDGKGNFTTLVDHIVEDLAGKVCFTSKFCNLSHSISFKI